MFAIEKEKNIIHFYDNINTYYMLLDLSCV